MSPMKSPPILLKSTPEHPLFDAVVFYDIIGFLRGSFFPIISINLYLVDNWFSAVISKIITMKIANPLTSLK